MCILLRMEFLILSLTMCLLGLAAEPVRTTSETLLATWERSELERISPTVSILKTAAASCWMDGGARFIN